MTTHKKTVTKIVGNSNMGGNMVYCSESHCFMMDKTSTIKIDDDVEYETDEDSHIRQVKVNGKILHHDRFKEVYKR